MYHSQNGFVELDLFEIHIKVHVSHIGSCLHNFYLRFYKLFGNEIKNLSHRFWAIPKFSVFFITSDSLMKCGTYSQPIPGFERCIKKKSSFACFRNLFELQSRICPQIISNRRHTPYMNSTKYLSRFQLASKSINTWQLMGRPEYTIIDITDSIRFVLPYWLCLIIYMLFESGSRV